MDKNLGPKILRAPGLRRGREIIPISNRVKLERVLGLTVSNNSAFDCDTNASIVAYPAGCVVVVHNLRKNKQGHILSSSKKTITSLSFSSDGKYLATGECGHQPHVRVWDVQEKVQVAEFQGHKYGINCVAFSPNFKYVVSVGSQHDMIVNVWDWKNNIKVASNKVSCKVKALSFASNGNYFVTVGNRHVKFWYLECSRSNKYKHEAVPLMGRSAILGDKRNNYFCDVACGKGNMWESTYAITKSGLLCEFNSRRLLDKWVELRTSSANSISVGDNLIIIGCSQGVIRCFNPYNLNYIATLPRPHYLGVDVAKRSNNSKSTDRSNTRFPDTIAIALDEISNKVTCVYNDHSLYVWDIKDIKKVRKSQSFMYHSACIWGVEVYPELHESLKSILPKGTFLTCSSDDTIRFWNLEPTLDQDTYYHRNIYSNELLKILYVDPELSYLCDIDLNSSGSNDKVDTTYDGKNGVRCLRISPDGKNLASGDRSGNIRIHNLDYVEEESCKIEAHDSEVLCLEYSKPAIVNGQETRYLASASRDRLIHVFDVKQDYTFQQTLDDHSSSITAVRFVQSGDALQMISCGADKSIIFRKATYNPQLSLLREHHVVGKTTLYDMEVDAQQSNILTACQDRNIRVYSVASGKHIRCFRGSQGEDGTLIKVVLDSSGTYLATSCTDKSLYLYDYVTGECLATMFGHSELVTGLKFTSDGRHLISVSGDGCIFVWKLPIDVTQNMLSKQTLVEGAGLPALWQDGRRNGVVVNKPLQIAETNGNSKTENTESVNEIPCFRFSIGQLPLWAKKQLSDNFQENSNAVQNLPPPVPPKGRWAERIDGQGLVVRSYLDSDAVIPYPNATGENHEVRNGHDTTLQNGFPSQLEDFRICEESRNEILNGTLNESSNKREKFSMLHSTLRSDMLHSTLRSSEDLDAEDEHSDSEISEMVYYPASEDGSDIFDSEFHVCANSEADKEIPLRKQKVERNLSEAPVMNTPEHEANSDDEEGSTPVDSDRSFLSSLCISTENLEKVGQREKFMQRTYESLEKNDSVEPHTNFVDKNFYRQSITAKFLAGSLLPSRRLLTNGNEKTPSKQMPTPSKKRTELMKALSETRKKLETVGFRNGLSSSKSIADLHSTPDRDILKTPKKISSGDIRRATSMIDLSRTSTRSPQFSTPSYDQNESKSEASAPLWNQSIIYPISTSPPQSPNNNTVKISEEINITKATPSSHSEVSRSSSSSSLYSKKQNYSGSLHKASSVYSLNQNFYRSATSLSLSSPGRSSLQPLPLRKLPNKLSNQDGLHSDSSSDSSPTESTPVMNNKTGLPGRPFNARTRYFSLSDNKNPLDSESAHTEDSAFAASESLQKLRLKSCSELDLKNKAANDYFKGKGDSLQSSQYLSYSPRRGHVRPLKPNLSKISTIDNSEERNMNHNAESSLLSCDPTSVPLTSDVCENIADNLSRVSAFVAQVYQRLTSTDLPPEQKSAMVNILTDGVWQAQQNLRPAVMSMMNPWPSMDVPGDPFRRLPSMNLSSTNGNDSSSMQRLQHSSLSQPDTMTFLEQLSDTLLNIFEKRMLNSQDKPNK